MVQISRPRPVTLPFNQPKRASVRVTCKACNNRCLGQLVRTFSGIQPIRSKEIRDVTNKSSANQKFEKPAFYHVSCFVCCVCNLSLLQSDGYFEHEGKLFCPSHYQILYGEKCYACGNFLSGRTVSALGKTYHQACLCCISCFQCIAPNERIATIGNDGILCNKCCAQFCVDDVPLSISVRCAGCKSKDMKEEETILALGCSFHPWCFKCGMCKTKLDGLYYVDPGGANLPTNEKALCTNCYRDSYVKPCNGCDNDIEPDEKRLTIGKLTFHPNCAKCHNCWLWFVDGEKVLFKNLPRSLPEARSPVPDSDVMVIHEDCAQSESRKFIESTNLDLPVSHTENYTSFKRFISTNLTPGVRRSWTFTSSSSNSPSIQAYLPKFGNQYPASYLDPRNLSSANNSLYCRFVSPDLTASEPLNPEEKSLQYHSLKFHDERLKDIPPSQYSNGHKLYPKELLSTLNKTLPKGVNRTKLESHLSNAEFFSVFHISKSEFYGLPIWKQVFLKKLHNLF